MGGSKNNQFIWRCFYKWNLDDKKMTKLPQGKEGIGVVKQAFAMGKKMNRNYIKPDGAIKFIHFQVMLCRNIQFLLLAACDGIFRINNSPKRAGFHLYKYQILTVKRYQIQFIAAMPPVEKKNGKTMKAQEIGGQGLSCFTNFMKISHKIQI